MGIAAMQRGLRKVGTGAGRAWMISDFMSATIETRLVAGCFPD
jgi:hypothetical protein